MEHKISIEEFQNEGAEEARLLDAIENEDYIPLDPPSSSMSAWEMAHFLDTILGETL